MAAQYKDDRTIININIIIIIIIAVKIKKKHTITKTIIHKHSNKKM